MRAVMMAMAVALAATTTATKGERRPRVEVRAWRDLRAEENGLETVCVRSSRSCLTAAPGELSFEAAEEDGGDEVEFDVRDADRSRFRHVRWRPAMKAASGPCRFERTAPRFGATMYESETPIFLEYSLTNCAAVAQGALEVHFRHMKRDAAWTSVQAGVTCEKVSGDCTGVVTLHKVLPGTHSFQVRAGDSHFAKTLFLIEVLPMAIPRAVSLFEPLRNGPAQDSDISRSGQEDRPCTLQVVIVGTLHWDGQKAIWASLLRALSELPEPARSTFVTFAQAVDSETRSTFARMLAEAGVWLERVPLELRAPREDRPVGALLRDLVTAIRRLLPVKAPLEACVAQCSASLARLVSLTIPGFGADLVQRMLGEFEGADVLFFANSKEYADVLLVESARLAGVSRIIMDLPNVDPHPEVAADVVVAPSRATLADPSVQRLPGRKVIIHPGIDQDRFARARRAPPPRCVVGFVARLEPEKSAGLFLEMVSRMPDLACDFVVVGDGSMRGALSDLATVLGVASRVLFTGMLHGEALAAMMARMHVVVNPSLSPSETFCIANVEAMALGVPVVSFGAGGVTDYLQVGHNGVLVDEISGHGLARGVQLALASRAALATGARATAKAFGIKDMAAKYIDLGMGA